MTTLKERMQELTQDLPRGWQAVLARKCGISPPSVAGWLSGATKSIDGKYLLIVADFFQVDPLWLNTGKGTKQPKQGLGLLAAPRQPIGLLGTSPIFHGTPIAAIEGTDPLPAGMIYIRESQVRFSAGNGRTPVFDEIQESVPRSYTIDWFVKEGMNPENCRRFKVDGDSMEPFLYDNDKVLVNLAETSVINGKVYALRYGEELRIKRVYRKIDGGLILHSDNPEFRPRDEEISPEVVAQHISIVGRVRDKSGTGGL